MNTLQLVILAAGMSRRFGRPKQLEPVGPSGETLIDYSLYHAKQTGFSRIHFLVSPENHKEIKAHYEKRYSDKFELNFIEQRVDDIPDEYTMSPSREKPWGTAHSIYSLKDCLKEQFAFINADDYYGPGAFEQISAHLAKITATSGYFEMAGYLLKDCLSDHGSVSRAICETKNDQVIRIKEVTDIRKEGKQIFGEFEKQEIELSEDAVVSRNFWGITPKIFLQVRKGFQEFLMDNIFNDENEFGFPGVINGMLKKHSLTVRFSLSEDPCFGLTNPEDIEEVSKKIKKLHKEKIYPSNLLS